MISLKTSELEVFAMMIFGAILIAIWIAVEAGKSGKIRKIRQNEITKTKIEFQNFLLIVKRLYPNFKYDHISKSFIIIKDKYRNVENKKIGNIEFHFSAINYARPRGDISVKISITIQNETFTKEVEKIDFVACDSFDYVNNLMEDLLDEIENDDNFVKLMLSTTY